MESSIPAASLQYCLTLWRHSPFDFVITRDRITKLGDYRFYSSSNRHKITVNAGLNPYAFLITYVHEFAHLEVQVKYGSRKQPHGSQWKQAFQQLMQPLLTHQVFPEKVLLPLRKHMLNPKASSHADQNLYVALRKYDTLQHQDATYLNELRIGASFELNNRSFVVILPKRTRVLCQDLGNKKNYLISKMAEVRCLHQGDSVEY